MFELLLFFYYKVNVGGGGGGGKLNIWNMTEYSFTILHAFK